MEPLLGCRPPPAPRFSEGRESSSRCRQGLRATTNRDGPVFLSVFEGFVSHSRLRKRAARRRAAFVVLGGSADDAWRSPSQRNQIRGKAGPFPRRPAGRRACYPSTFKRGSATLPGTSVSRVANCPTPSTPPHTSADQPAWGAPVQVAQAACACTVRTAARTGGRLAYLLARPTERASCPPKAVSSPGETVKRGAGGVRTGARKASASPTTFVVATQDRGCPTPSRPTPPSGPGPQREASTFHSEPGLGTAIACRPPPRSGRRSAPGDIFVAPLLPAPGPPGPMIFDEAGQTSCGFYTLPKNIAAATDLQVQQLGGQPVAERGGRATIPAAGLRDRAKRSSPTTPTARSGPRNMLQTATKPTCTTSHLTAAGHGAVDRVRPDRLQPCRSVGRPERPAP